MRKLFNWAAARIVAAFALALPFAAIAEVQMTNPVTGETELYANAFVGEGNWGNASNWDTGITPFISGNYNPAVVTGKLVTASKETAIDGWTLRVGAYNSAMIYLSGGITKIQSDTNGGNNTGCWLTADETSVIEVKSFAGNQLEGSDSAPFKLSSANVSGITWVNGITNASNTTLPFWYYLKGNGTVAYNGPLTVANAQVIKMADITLSGTSQVASKKIVSFTSSSKTFTADATIKVKNGNGDILRAIPLTSVTAAEGTTLTTDNHVGSCELVQTSTGIVLYYVDGDPENLPVYKPSININFTSGAANGLTTRADVGLDGYAVPGTSWNNLVVANNTTYSTVNAIDSTGVASAASGVSVTVSGTRGSHYCSSLVPASNPLHGYIDESAEYMTPTVTITGIPYEHYRVIVYHSTDQNSVPFGHDTINGFDFTYVNGAQTTGSDTWGNSGASSSANPIEEGVNTLVSAVLSGDTVTMVAHRVGINTPTARGCFAAIQVVEYVPEVGENDLEIAVNGAMDLAVDTEKTLSGTVYLTGSGTLTLSGSEKITAATIDVGSDVVLNINADRLDATTFTGAGTVVYDGAAPVAGKGWAAIGWSGTVWIKNYAIGGLNPGDFANASSTLRLSVCTGYFNDGNNTKTCAGTLDLQNDTGDYAFAVDNGWSTEGKTIFAKLTGSGTLGVQTKDIAQRYIFKDASGFTGTINLAGRPLRVIFGDGESLAPAEGTITVASGATVTVPSGKTWTANKNGFVVNGTLNVAGTLSSTAASAVSGSGTVTFGGVPSPTGDAWWKNAAWTGTVEIKGAAALNGDYVFNDYGNAGSTLKLTNCSGWLKPNYTCVPALEIGGTFTWNDGSSNLGNTFKVATLKGSGTISIPSGGAATAVWQITDDWSGFTGAVVGNNSSAARVLVFGATLPTTVTAGEIYISEGATLDLDNSSSAWWGVGMGFVVDGTVKASARNKWGGGTYMTLGDTGVLEFVSSANTNDENTDMSGITGTGTLKFSSSAGWRAFPKTDANMPATTLTIQSELADSLILPTKTNGVTVVGNLAGSKNIRSDWSNNGEDGRILTVTQSKNTEWQGKFVSNRITKFNVVDPAEGTPGTLTLSGAQDTTIPMQIDGSVNLTGTWKGATTVAGTIGGTGTLTGNLTFSDGATFKAFSTDSDGLAVSGTVAYPETGTVTVDFEETPVADTVLLTASDLDASKFALATGVSGSLAVEEGALVYKSPFVTITVPAVANATASVTVGGEPVSPITEGGNSYYVIEGSAVTVTYSANDGYELSGTATYTIESAGEGSTITITDTQAAAYVAALYTATTTKYTTLQAAVTAAADARNSKLVLLASTESESATIPAVDSAKFYVVTNVYECGTIAYPAGDYIVATTSGTIDIDGVGEGLAATVYSATKAAVAVTVSGEERTLYDGSSISVAVSTAIAGGLGSKIEFVNGTDSTPYVSTLEASGFTVENNVWTFTTLPIAKVTHGVTETSYLTLASAFANVQDGDTITLLGDVALDSTVVITNSVTLDLNGKTITGPAGGYAFSNAGEVTIENGTITGAGGVAENTADGASIAVSSGSYTATGDLFGNVEGGTIAVSGGTFNQSVADEYLAEGFEVKDNGDGTYGVRESFGWIYEAADHPNYTGSWSNDVGYAEGKIKIEDGNTYTANRPSDGQLVTVAMTLSFDDANDEDEDLGDAKAAVRLASGQDEGTYQFQLYTFDGANKVWTNATVEAVTATKEHDYTFVFVLDLTNKVYTATVVDGVTTNVMTVGGVTNILFANQGAVTPVQQIEFIGAGTVTSIEGSYEDAEAPVEEFNPNEEVTINGASVMLTSNQAAWLNACSESKAEKGAVLGGLSETAFNNAYLLNLDITDPAYDGTFTFKVTDFTVGDATVSVTVTLTRKGKLDGGINGTLKLTGTADLDTDFAVISVTPVGDDDFSGGDTATWTFDKGSVKFFQPVIE